MSNIVEKSRTLVLTRGFVLGALVVVGALLTAVGAAQQTPSAASIQVDKVRDNLYVLRGGLGNTAAFITAKGVTLVDTKLPGWGRPIIDANNGGSGVEYPKTIAKAAAELKNIDTIITGHSPTTLAMADLKTFADFTREFVQAVQAAKKAGRTIDDVVNSWKVPERFQKDGYPTPEQIQQMLRYPVAAQTARLRSNVEVIWNETN